MGKASAGLGTAQVPEFPGHNWKKTFLPAIYFLILSKLGCSRRKKVYFSALPQSLAK